MCFQHSFWGPLQDTQKCEHLPLRSNDPSTMVTANAWKRQMKPFDPQHVETKGHSGHTSARKYCTRLHGKYSSPGGNPLWWSNMVILSPCMCRWCTYGTDGCSWMFHSRVWYRRVNDETGLPSIVKMCNNTTWVLGRSEIRNDSTDFPVR